MAQSVPIEMVIKVELSKESRELLEMLLRPGQGGTVKPPAGGSDQYFGVGGYGSQER